MPRNRTVVEADHGDEIEVDASSADGRPAPEDAPPSTGPTESEYYASQLRESTSSMLLYTAMAPLFKEIDSSAYKLYRDRLLADSGSPTDPVEVMLLEQLGLAHFCTCLLAAKTTNSGNVEVCGVYAAAYARIMAEFRRTAVATQAYRHANRQLAREPARDTVALDAPSPAGDVAPENDTGDEQAGRTEETDAGEDIIRYPEPAPAAARTFRSGEAPAHAGGPRKAARRGAGDPPVGAVHRAAE
jgi:hypothetical protein